MQAVKCTVSVIFIAGNSNHAQLNRTLIIFIPSTTEINTVEQEFGNVLYSVYKWIAGIDTCSQKDKLVLDSERATATDLQYIHT